MEIQAIKQRFGIIGNSPLINRALDIARQVAPTDLTVLVSGESGTGKEFFPKIIHQLSSRKHGEYIAVNCGAIPEGTIDSELFGHEKGSFTSADKERKGYFEVANGGTIFLDEVGELPLGTQVRLLRVLESGEYIRVGSSKSQKTNVRVVAATNVNLLEAVRTGRFREDLYYRLNTVPIMMPALMQRKEDILLLFRKFASDFAEKYRMPTIQLSEEAQKLLVNYRWPGNIRQLKNITEQISIIEKNREISAEILTDYIPLNQSSKIPVLYNENKIDTEFSEREILYKVLFDMKNDIFELKRLIGDIIQGGVSDDMVANKTQFLQRLHRSQDPTNIINTNDRNVEVRPSEINIANTDADSFLFNDSEIIEDSLSIGEKELELIKRALIKYKGKRKYAAKDLGISERTLYRKIKEYNLE